MNIYIAKACVKFLLSVFIIFLISSCTSMHSKEEYEQASLIIQNYHDRQLLCQRTNTSVEIKDYTQDVMDWIYFDKLGNMIGQGLPVNADSSFGPAIDRHAKINLIFGDRIRIKIWQLNGSSFSGIAQRYYKGMGDYKTIGSVDYSCKSWIEDNTNYRPEADDLNQAEVQKFIQEYQTLSPLDMESRFEKILTQEPSDEKLYRVRAFIKLGVYLNEMHVEMALGKTSGKYGKEENRGYPDYRVFRYLSYKFGSPGQFTVSPEGLFELVSKSASRRYRQPYIDYAERVSFFNYFYDSENFLKPDFLSIVVNHYDNRLYANFRSGNYRTLERVVIRKLLDDLNSVSIDPVTKNIFFMMLSDEPYYYYGLEEQIKDYYSNSSAPNPSFLNTFMQSSYGQRGRNLSSDRCNGRLSDIDIKKVTILQSKYRILERLANNGSYLTEESLCIYNALEDQISKLKKESSRFDIHTKTSVRNAVEIPLLEFAKLKSLLVEHGILEIKHKFELNSMLAGAIKKNDQERAIHYITAGAMADQNLLVQAISHKMNTVSESILRQDIVLDYSVVAEKSMEFDWQYGFNQIVTNQMLTIENAEELAYLAASTQKPQYLEALANYGVDGDQIMDKAINSKNIKAMEVIAQVFGGTTEDSYNGYVALQEEERAKREVEAKKREEARKIAKRAEDKRIQDDYSRIKQVGEKICAYGTQLLFFSVKITGYVESKSGDRIQVRIHDTGGYSGDRYKEGYLIWDSYWNWRSCE